MDRIFLVCFFSLFLVVCVRHSEHALPLEFRRSILDQQPRMISIWHDQYHVSYDLQKCNLYKIWTGGIHWDGAAFNNIKTVQPSTWGAVVLHDTTAWQIEGESNTQVDYLGYNVEASSLQFNYEVNPTDGTSIPITEKVAFIQTNDSVHLQITFSYDQTEDFQIRRNGQTIYGSRKFSFPQQVEAPTTNPALGTWSQYWLDRSGCNTCHNQAENTVGPSYENIASRYENTEEVRKLLAARIKAGSIGQWGATPMIPHPNLGEQDLAGMVRYILSLRPQKTAPTQVYQPSEQYLPVHQKPGFGAALEGIHPSYTLSAIRPEGFEPRVGGMDFDKDGNLYISTWDNAGAVYKLSGLGFDDVNRIKIQQIANGLAEPLGLKIVDEELFVVQKNELTQLVDHNSDGITDEYRSICDAFDVSADFHEYSYGLEFLDGHFYLTLGLAMRLMAHERQLRDRGTMIKVARDGSYEIFATGLRQPNGIGLVDGYKLFSTENQGQWVPACKLINIRKGDHYGCQFQTGLRYSDSKITPPVVWLPQDEIGNSPSQPVPVRDGPYRGQILFGEVTHGGIKRVFLEEVSGALQGCVFRFTQGLEAGVNRLAWGPDGSLYVGGVGMNGNWAWQGRQFGLQKLTFNEKTTFEMLAVRAIPNGFEIEFTEPADAEQLNNPAMYSISQWTYKTTAAYGSPKIDFTDLPVSKVDIDEEAQRVRIQIPGLKEKYVIYILLSPDIKSARKQRLWSGEAWYTLNHFVRHENL